MGLRAAHGAGAIALAHSEDGRVQLTREEFALLIGGIDLTRDDEAEVVSQSLLPKESESSQKVA